ncbi:MAG: hypothetical protein ABI353_17640 [Isosphaeraceae bacterium]
MNPTRVWTFALSLGCLATALGAAPAASTSREVEQSIDQIRAGWAKPGAGEQPNAPGWNAFFDRLNADLGEYAAAKSEDDRLRSLTELHQLTVALRGVGWAPAAEVNENLRAWLRPRVALAWAIRSVRDSVRSLPETGNPSVQGNRDRWLSFTENNLGAALRDYEGASTVLARRDALKRVYGALNSLSTGNQARPWTPSMALENALDDLYNVPNLDATADVHALAPALNQDVVETGPIFFKGQLSYVTAGPKTGFGLLPSDDGIAFFNSQAMTTITPINNFQGQVSEDQKGRRAAKMYYFNATSQNNSELTITAVVRPSGLALAPAYLHSISAAVGSLPIQGKGLTRGVASMIGLNQNKITDKVYDGAIGKIQQGVVDGSSELGAIKANEAAAEKNAKIQQYLVGNDTARYNNLAVTGLSLRSRPEFALIGGTVQWQGANEQVGADAPQPRKFQTSEPGITADLHLGSVLTNLVRGYLQSPAGARVQNLMVVTKKIPPNTPPQEGIATSENVDFETFRTAAATARAAKDPKVMAIRVKTPGVAPEFTADARGYLVALVHDFVLEVPAPEAAMRGGLFGPPAQIYRVSAPNAEFTISFQIEAAKGTLPIRLAGRVEGFDAGPGAQVFAINDDEAKASPLSAFTRVAVLNTFANRLKGQPIDVPLSNLNLGNYALNSVSPLDPSGWIRLNLVPAGSTPAPVPTVQPVAQRSASVGG